ncbi:carbohydrate esterase family 1 protein [Nemania serpens]|nr:carbohydrate esterase family 1 protein [Nemania serpens]
MRTAFSLVGLTAVAAAYKSSTVSSWSDNPSKLGSVIVLTPNTIASKPALILALHPCGGSGSGYQSMTTLPSQIDALNFIMIFPTSNKEDGFNCWDAFSTKSNVHGGGGDSQGLAGLTKQVIQQYGADTNKVFVIGASSGAMESNVLAATYPDIFKAAVSYSGVPAGCWLGAASSTPLATDQSCPLGSKASTYSAKQWTDLVKQAYPSYTGSYPKMMIVHGTADFAVTINNLGAQLTQWSNMAGVTFSQNVTNTPIQSWKKIVYGDGTKVVGYEVQGGGHIPPFQLGITLDWFGLKK